MDSRLRRGRIRQPNGKLPSDDASDLNANTGTDRHTDKDREPDAIANDDADRVANTNTDRFANANCVPDGITDITPDHNHGDRFAVAITKLTSGDRFAHAITDAASTNSPTNAVANIAAGHEDGNAARDGHASADGAAIESHAEPATANRDAGPDGFFDFLDSVP